MKISLKAGKEFLYARCVKRIIQHELETYPDRALTFLHFLTALCVKDTSKF
jgi:hypothetical protein